MNRSKRILEMLNNQTQQETSNEEHVAFTNPINTTTESLNKSLKNPEDTTERKFSVHFQGNLCKFILILILYFLSYNL